MHKIQTNKYKSIKKYKSHRILVSLVLFFALIHRCKWKKYKFNASGSSNWIGGSISFKLEKGMTADLYEVYRKSDVTFVATFSYTFAPLNRNMIVKIGKKTLDFDSKSGSSET